MDLTHAEWRKSGYSAGNEGECVEIATNLRNVIAIRDSKNPHGPALVLTPSQWTALLNKIKQS